MINDIDYRTLSDADIAGIVEANRDELHAGCLTAESVLKALASGRTFIHQHRNGFYITQSMGHCGTHLWVLYVDPAHRGKGIGSDMVKDAITIYSSTGEILLQCFQSLRSFYENLGFCVEDSDDDTCYMSGSFG